MANTKSAAKRARQIQRRSMRNRTVLARIRTLTRRGSPSEANNVRDLISAIDKAAKRGIIHRNAANRRKARLLRKHGSNKSVAPREADRSR